MAEFFEIMAKPFFACLILAGIHVYLGLHVIERGVIFVDLALAQIAAFGATVGFLFGYSLHSQESYFCAFGFTLLGAGIFALTRHRKQMVPQEAFIGVIYAVFAAASVIVLSHAPEGGEELKSLLVGHILFVDWDEIIQIFVLYGILGVLHWFIRKPLLMISQNPEAAFEKGLRVKCWDFIFYGLFGLVVTSSVELAGVLVVFSFLIVPSICAVLFSKNIGVRLAIGWFCGGLTSCVGIVASYFLDLPTGATIVCAFGVCLLACLLLKGTGLGKA